jgi:hypothetical protein
MITEDWHDVVKEKDFQFAKLLEAAEDLVTALIELAPDSYQAAQAIKDFKRVRDHK